MARLLRIAGALVALGSMAAFGPVRGQTAEPVPPTAVPVPNKATPQWPRTLDDAKPGAAGPQWSPTEIEQALSRCMAILKDIEVVAVPAQPMREGECGAPAPIELVSVGRSPQVTLSQPALVTCEMAAALDRWLKESVQPAAKKHLGAPVIRMQVMSGYSCRNAYGRKKTRLSEHGRANALDLKGFLTERNATIDVALGWGMTARDVRAQVAAAEAARKEAERKAAEKAEQDRIAAERSRAGGGTGTAPQPANPDLRGPIADGQPLLKVPDLGIVRRDPHSFSLNPPSRLGGPKPKKEPPTLPHAADAPGAHQAFLRQIHAEACKYFGTVLGPETNEAHRNHFHIDMAERAVGNYCE